MGREEIKEAKEKKTEIAAFFDLDGTLIAPPSLERRFFRALRRRREIGGKNIGWWVLEALRLAPRGIIAMMQSNKMYLRGVMAAEHKNDSGDRTKWEFVRGGIERVAGHAKQGDTVVIVSGTLEFLAEEAARAVENILSQRGIVTKVRVCATRLEEKDGKWTGRIAGEAMFGGAKARAVQRLAAQMGFDLKRSHAYGDSAQDYWLLDAVGHPSAVNPSPRLCELARQKSWPILRWNDEKTLTPGGVDVMACRGA